MRQVRSSAHAGLSLLLLLLALSTPVSAVEIIDPAWGFDGRVRLDRFNLLTVTLVNPANDTVTFDLILQKRLGTGPVDAPVVQRIALGPGARRIAQLYPYVSTDYATWWIKCGPQSIEVPQPRPALHGARVLLESVDLTNNSSGSIKRFPAAQFPPFETATDTLDAVLLDHVPTWEEPRRQAFLDWLYRGGAVYILQNSAGQFPEFSGPLTALNSPLERSSYGAGSVFKVNLKRTDLNRDTTRQLWKRLPNRMELPKDPNAELKAETGGSVEDDDDEDGTKTLPYSMSDGSHSVKSRSFLENLGKMTKPDHNWWLLHGMFWVYIALIFPGCYILGQQRSDFRVVYFAIVGIVLVFSLAFGIVGRRGYGERTTIHSVAIVQPLADGQLDVSQWSNTFVTSGATYDIEHLGAGVLYSVCQDSESVRGLIVNGNEALFKVDIPPFSSREFALRAKLPGTLPAVTVKEFSHSGNTLGKLTLTVDETFPAAEEMYVLYRDRFYSVARRDREITLRSGIGTVPAFLKLEGDQNYYSPFGGGYGNDDRSVEARYHELFVPLIARSLNLRTEKDAKTLRWSDGHLRFMYFAPLLPDLQVQNPRFTNQQGKVLYCQDLVLPE